VDQPDRIRGHATFPLAFPIDLLDAMFDPIAIHAAVRDAEGRIVDFRTTYVNPANVAASGLTSEEQVGHRSAIERTLVGSPSFAEFVRVVETGEPSEHLAMHSGKPTAGRSRGGTFTDLRVERFGDGVLATTHIVADLAGAEKEIADGAERHRSVVDNLAEGVIVQDTAGRIVSSNGAAQAILGLSIDELTGLTSVDPRWHAIHEDGTPFRDDEHPLTITLSTGMPVRDVVMGVQHASGDARWLVINSRPLRDSSSRAITGAVASFQDVTKWRHEERSWRDSEEAALLAHARLRRFLDANVIGVVVAKPTGAVVEANDYYLDLVGVTRDELEGGAVDWCSFTPPEWLQFDQRAAAELNLRGACLPYEKELLRRDGRRVPVLIAQAILPGASPEIVAFALDNSQRVLAARELALMTRLYAMRSQVNQSIARVKEPAHLYQSMCDVAVNVGHFVVAWIGILDDATGDVKPVAASGADVASWPFEIVNMHRGVSKDGLVVSAIRTDKVVASEDIATDERMRGSNEQLQGHGFSSIAAIPFRLKGEPLGVLVLVSQEPGFFRSASEIGLLDEMGLDISFALDTMATEAERRRAEEENRRLAAAIEQSTEAVVITDLAGRIEYVNPAFERVSGYTRAEALGRNPRILKSGVQDSAFYEAMWATLASGNPFVGDMTNRRKDGSLYEEEAVISPVVDKNGVITSYVAVKRDVTRERASDAARDRRARERVLIAGALADLQVLPTAAATAHLICRQVGRLAGIVGAVLYIFTPDGSALPVAVVRADSAHVTLRRLAVPRSRRLRDRAEAGPWVEDWNRRPGHTQVFAGLAVRAVGYAPIRQGRRLIGLLTIASAEEDALSQLTESLPALLEFAGFAGALIGPAVADLAETSRIRKRILAIIADGAFRPVFQPVVDLTTGTHIGYEALARFSNGIAPDLVFADARAAGLEAELERATLVAAIADSAVLPRGAWLSLNVSPDLATKDGSLGGILEASSHPIVLEITEHALVADYPALRTAISRLRPDVKVAVDDAGAGVANFSHIVDLRPAFVKMDIGLVRGIDADPTRRALMVGLLHFASESASQTIAEGVETDAELTTLKELGVPLAQGYLLGRPAPAAEWAQGPASLPAGGDRGMAAAGMGELAVGTRKDADVEEDVEEDVIAQTPSDTSEAERGRGDDAELARTERLVAVGRFAGGIAHDFNNVLTAIRMYAQLARDGLPDHDPIRDDLAQVLASAERAAAITRTLLAFTRREVLAPVDLDPAAAIEALMPILGSLLGDDVPISLDIEASHGSVRADPSQLDQVLVNLAVNARDAMPTGGTLTIAVHNLAPAVRDPGADPGQFVRISVSDTGIGMDEATRLRIFDPFYTTRGEVGGTGLGLWTVARIVAESGGRIRVETALGKGTTFHVDLQRVETVQKHDPPQAAAKAMRTRSGEVIVADDDEPVRRLVQRSLEASGYTVHAAANAEEALQAAERWAGQIDVLVTDVAMPGLPGPELAALVRATQPDIGVVFISGNAEDSTIRDGGPHGTFDFLPKPFSIEELRVAVGRALDSAIQTRDRRASKG
jgi:PAS domain S-box-containing protein